MKKWRLSIISLLLSAVIFSFTKQHNQRNHRNPSQTGFTLIELFTSEGCSSCPPADEIIADIQNQYKDKHVLALGYHVDYWDHLGWKDPFSAAEFTSRQKYYADVFNLNSIYTPEAVINGSEEFVGSDRSRLKQIITENINTISSASINLEATQDVSGKIKIKYSSKVNTTAAKQLVLLLVQKSGYNKIGSGENAGKTLQHINIVRDILYLPVSIKEAQAFFALPVSLHKEDLFVAALIQRKNEGHIIAIDSTAIK